MEVNNKTIVILILIISSLLVTMIGCQSTGQGQAQRAQIPPPRPTEREYDVEELMPAQGWMPVETFYGSGMDSFCPKVYITKPWRLRWNVGVPTSRFGDGSMAIEVFDGNTPPGWKKDLLKSDHSSIEYTSPVFTNTVKSLCIFARSNRTDYVILVEQKAK